MKRKCNRHNLNLLIIIISNSKVERLKSDLQRNETERETQLVAMRVAYEDFKVYNCSHGCNSLTQC